MVCTSFPPSFSLLTEMGTLTMFPHEQSHLYLPLSPFSAQKGGGRVGNDHYLSLARPAHTVLLILALVPPVFHSKAQKNRRQKDLPAS